MQWGVPNILLISSIQRQKHPLEKQEEKHSDAVWPFHKADHRFYWNRHLQETFVEKIDEARAASLAPYFVPLTQGFVHVSNVKSHPSTTS